MDWFSNNLTSVLAVIGLLLLTIEVTVLGFSTFVLLFVGIAALLTSGIFYVELVPATYFNALLSISVFTALSAASLYRPLQNMQKDAEKRPVTNDLVGLRFVIDAEVGPSASATYVYSGVTWAVKSRQVITAGTEVEVISVDVGLFQVKPV